MFEGSTTDRTDVYREYPTPRELTGSVACTWVHQPAVDSMQLIIPDACVDLIWLAGNELVIAGPDTGPREAFLPGGRRSSGIRLRPGAAGAFLGMPASEIRDVQVAAEDMWGDVARRLADVLATADAQQQQAVLCEALELLAPIPDPLVLAAASSLALPGSRVAAVADELGVSERQLHRRTVTAIGYGPKTLARVLRLRRLMALPSSSLAGRALAAGYSNQAHMTDEVRRLTGRSPVRFLEDHTFVAA